MPATKLSRAQRRELLLRALGGENRTALAREYGISETLLYRMIGKAREDALAEYEFWQCVVEILDD